jgi:hypothetical protein
MRRLTRTDLAGKRIDVHSHAGVSLKAYACGEYPYAATIEGLAALQEQGGIDVNVVFPYTADLYFDPAHLMKGEAVPSAHPLSPAPYESENELLLRENYGFCPETADRFLPFISMDPCRDIDRQIKAIEGLRHPVYGVKTNPVLCQSPVSGLLNKGRALMELIESRGWPVLFHVAASKEEAFSNAEMAFRVVEAFPKTRFCLAHCIGFHKEYLDRAAALPNVWVDTSALKIQVQLVHENNPLMPSPADRIDADFSDHKKVMQALVSAYPDKIIWGSDAPAYSYICRRKQAEGVFTEFRLKGSYRDEVAALDSLSREKQLRAANRNSLDFVFGRTLIST